MSLMEREAMGIKDDPGKWLPFAIDMGVITAVKLASDDRKEESYNCAVIFTSHGETFILDTPYEQMVAKWADYVDSMFHLDDIEPPFMPGDNDDINL
jgi:galactokinase